MTRDYQARIELLLTRAGVPSGFHISYRSVFGARAACADGALFATCGRFGFALKLPEKTCRHLFEEGLGSPLKYFEKGHIKKSYAVLDDRVLDDRRRLHDLIDESVRFASGS